MNRVELLDAVIKTKPAITNSTLVEQANVVIFNKKEIQSYNDEILISIPIKTDIEGGVPATELYTLLNKMGDEKINITQKKDVMFIKGKTTKAKFKIVPVDFPKMAKVKKWNTLPTDFVEGLKLCKFSTGEVGDVLNNVYVKEDKLISCDNYRMTEYTMLAKMMECLIPSSIAHALVSFNPFSCSSDKSWLFFKNIENAIFCIRRVKDKFPDIGEVLNTKIKGDKITLSDTLRDNLKRTEILSDEDIVTGNRTITVSISDGKVVCHGECDAGQIDETIKTDYEGKEISFTIIPAFLCDILDKTHSMKVGESSLHFKTKNFQHIIQIAKREAE